MYKSESYSELMKLHERFCENPSINYRDEWIKSFRKFSNLKRQSLVDISVDAANISLSISGNPELLSDPLVVAALQDTVPSFDFDNPFTGEALEGAINTAKGKYFEYLVVDRLNNGQRVGDVILPEGYTAQIAESMNQPGWDVQILDSNQHVSDYLQLKATDNLAYIKEALDRYPDMTILTTDEIATDVFGAEMVLGSGVSNDELGQSIQAAMGETDSALTEGFLDAFNPLLPLAFILGTEGFRLGVSKGDIKQAVLSTSHRVTRTIASQTIGALVFSLGGGWLALPTTILTGVVYENLANEYEYSVVIRNAHESMVLLRLQQQEMEILRY